jgi:hypothetical protein
VEITSAWQFMHKLSISSTTLWSSPSSVEDFMPSTWRPMSSKRSLATEVGLLFAAIVAKACVSELVLTWVTLVDVE